MQVGSPDWWLFRLFNQLSDRRANIDLMTTYYEGQHPLPWLAPQARDEFRRILRMTRSNYCGLVVDAQVERLQIEGFRLTNGESSLDDQNSDKPDAEMWRIWQDNDMDSDSDSMLLESAICGVSYLHTAPNPMDSSTPLMWAEHPSQAIVDYMPGMGRRMVAAGLKTWTDDWTGQLCATLQLPGYIFKYTAKMNTAGGVDKWIPREVVGEQWGGPNLAGEVTLVEVPNKPRLLLGGVSELSDVTDIQDRINKTLADRLITQDYGAFPQRWMKGWPTEDEAGVAVPLINIGRNRFVSTDATEAAFGQWDAAPLDPYSAAKREDVKDIASRTRTPAQYLLGEMSNVNGETLKASEAGLISKIRSRMRGYEQGVEASMRIVRKLAGLPDVGARGMETIWRNPEFRTQGELTDSIVKLLSEGVIDIRQAREDAGYSATQIARMESREAVAQDVKNKAIFGTLTDKFTQQPQVGGGDQSGTAGN